MSRLFTPSQLLQEDNHPANFGQIAVSSLFEAEDGAGNTIVPQKTMLSAPLRMGRQPVRLLLKGELMTEGFSTKAFENGQEKTTFGISLTNDEDYEAMNALLTKVKEASDIDLDDGQWTVRPIFRANDLLYLKVKLNKDGTAYTFSSNFKLNPRKAHPDMHQYTPVEVTVGVNAYYNSDDMGVGLFFPVQHIQFLGTAVPPAKQQNHRDVETQTDEYNASQEPLTTRGRAVAPNYVSTNNVTVRRARGGPRVARHAPAVVESAQG